MPRAPCVYFYHVDPPKQQKKKEKKFFNKIFISIDHTVISNTEKKLRQILFFTKYECMNQVRMRGEIADKHAAATESGAIQL